MNSLASCLLRVEVTRNEVNRARRLLYWRRKEAREIERMKQSARAMLMATWWRSGNGKG